MIINPNPDFESVAFGRFLNKIIRGASWYSKPNPVIDSVRRDHDEPSSFAFNLGFRPVCALKKQSC